MWHWWVWFGVDAKYIQCSGICQCPSRQLLRSKLALEGIELDLGEPLWPWHRSWPKHIKNKHLQKLLQQWSQLLSAGLPLLTCVTLVRIEEAPPRLRYELIELKNALLTGVKFSQALSQSGLFPTHLVQLVAAGEVSGELAHLLEQIYEQYSHQENLKRRFKRSLFMPAVTLLSGCIVSLLIIYWVVPQVASLYTSGVYELPVMTRWLMSFSHVAKSSGWAMVGVLLFTYMTWAWLWSMPKTRVSLERLLWGIPGLGQLMYLHSQAQLFLVLSMTFNARVPLLDCLTLAANSSPWEHVNRDLEKAILGLNQGQTLSQMLVKMGWQAPALQLIRVGEAAGNLALSFTQLQTYYEAQVINQSQWLEQLLEPILLLLVAIFVGSILVALYLPLFQIGQMM